MAANRYTTGMCTLYSRVCVLVLVCCTVAQCDVSEARAVFTIPTFEGTIFGKHAYKPYVPSTKDALVGFFFDDRLLHVELDGLVAPITAVTGNGFEVTLPPTTTTTAQSSNASATAAVGSTLLGRRLFGSTTSSSSTVDNYAAYKHRRTGNSVLRPKANPNILTFGAYALINPPMLQLGMEVRFSRRPVNRELIITLPLPAPAAAAAITTHSGVVTTPPVTFDETALFDNKYVSYGVATPTYPQYILLTQDYVESEINHLQVVLTRGQNYLDARFYGSRRGDISNDMSNPTNLRMRMRYDGTKYKPVCGFIPDGQIVRHAYGIIALSCYDRSKDRLPPYYIKEVDIHKLGLRGINTDSAYEFDKKLEKEREKKKRQPVLRSPEKLFVGARWINAVLPNGFEVCKKGFNWKCQFLEYIEAGSAVQKVSSTRGVQQKGSEDNGDTEGLYNTDNTANALRTALGLFVPFADSYPRKATVDKSQDFTVGRAVRIFEDNGRMFVRLINEGEPITDSNGDVGDDALLIDTPYNRNCEYRLNYIPTEDGARYIVHSVDVKTITLFPLPSKKHLFTKVTTPLVMTYLNKPTTNGLYFRIDDLVVIERDEFGNVFHGRVNLC